MCCRRRENGRSAREKTENKPRQLVVSIARGVIHRYIEGYLQDPAFEGHWRASLLTADELVTTHWYYKDEDGLLFFQDADWKACLCVPRLIPSHQSSMDAQNPTPCNIINYLYFFDHMSQFAYNYRHKFHIQSITLKRQLQHFTLTTGTTLWWQCCQKIPNLILDP